MILFQIHQSTTSRLSYTCIISHMIAMWKILVTFFPGTISIYQDFWNFNIFLFYKEIFRWGYHFTCITVCNSVCLLIFRQWFLRFYEREWFYMKPRAWSWRVVSIFFIWYAAKLITQFKVWLLNVQGNYFCKVFLAFMKGDDFIFGPKLENIEL